MIKLNSQKIAAKGKQKKTNFVSCNGCFGIFPAGVTIKAPKNKYNLSNLCGICFNQYIGSHSPVPSTAAAALKNQYGAYLIAGGAGILSNFNAGLISNNSHGILSNANAGIVPTAGGNLVGNDGAS